MEAEKEEVIMIVNKAKCRLGATDLLLALTAVLYCIGIRVWFPVCDGMGEMIMSCHWAGEVMAAGSVLAVVLTAVHAVVPQAGMKMGLDCSLIGLGVLGALIPGLVISLCQSPEMRCRAMTQPWSVGFCAALILLAAADLLFWADRANREKHARVHPEGGV